MSYDGFCISGILLNPEEALIGDAYLTVMAGSESQQGGIPRSSDDWYFAWAASRSAS